VNGYNPGWADAMARVLNSKKPRKSRSIVLCRAKKLNEPAKTVKEEETAVEAGHIKQEVSSLEQNLRRKVSNSTTCRSCMVNLAFLLHKEFTLSFWLF
jgi:hypothetical protein